MAGQDVCGMPIHKPVPTSLSDMNKCQMTHGREMRKETQVHPCIQPRQDPCAPAHNEFICHMMGEKRQHYLTEVKKILDKMDTTECPQKSIVEGMHGTGGKSLQERPMMKFPGYIDLDSPKFRKPFYAPLISSVPVKEIRPTDKLSKHMGENSETLQYVDIEDPLIKPCKPWALPRQKSFELRCSLMFKGCDCYKHNGLQDRCERSDCKGSPECLTQPSPTCPPSLVI
uniref:Keratin-associated protein 9-1-like protein n=1 Tax=Triatoma infestans TaxID=30076 RepID=A0A161MM61_TRIIF